jgi:hypothetical protein
MGISKLFVRSIACAFAIIVFGTVQSQAQKIFSLGIKAGMTTSNLFTKGTPTMGMTAGLIGEIKLVKWMRLRTEANLLVHGTEKHFWEKDDVDYFAVGMPVILEFMPIKNLYIGAGAELDYLVASTGGEVAAQNRFNFGLLAHIEYRFCSRLGLGLRYVHNLGNFSEFQQIGNAINDENSPTAAFPGSSVQMTLSYNFGG